MLTSAFGLESGVSRDTCATGDWGRANTRGGFRRANDQQSKEDYFAPCNAYRQSDREHLGLSAAHFRRLRAVHLPYFSHADADCFNLVFTRKLK